MWISPKLYNDFIAARKAGNPQYDVEMDEETFAVQNCAA